jgi:hypothetical protein
MKLSRRQFIIGGIGAGLGVSCAGYLHDESMQRAPYREGKILCDLHAHPGRDLEDTARALASHGLVGVAYRPCEKILTYEDAQSKFGGEEVFPGLMRFKEGYYMRTQEITSSKHHILAIGWEGDYIEGSEDPFENVRKIHDRGGIAVLCHPYVLSGGTFKFHIANEAERDTIDKLCEEIDLIETHNAIMINLWPIANMNKGNKLAAELAKRTELPAISSSDTHYVAEQLKVCGIYVDDEYLTSMDKFKEVLVKGKFDRFGSWDKGPYLSRWSFFKGFLL